MFCLRQRRFPAAAERLQQWEHSVSYTHLDVYKRQGLGFAVKMAKENFIGKAALEANEGQKRQRIGLKVTGRGIIREHQDVLLGGEKIGVTTSGTHCPYLGYPIAMALVSEGSTELGSKVEVEVRGRKVEAEVTALPFYKRSK